MPLGVHNNEAISRDSDIGFNSLLRQNKYICSHMANGLLKYNKTGYIQTC